HGGVVEPDDGVLQLGPGLLLEGLGLLELVGAEDLLAEEDVSKVAAGLGHGNRSPVVREQRGTNDREHRVRPAAARMGGGGREISAAGPRSYYHFAIFPQ